MVKSFRGRSLASSVRSSQEDSAPILDSSVDFYAKVIESRGKGQFLVSLPSTPDSTESKATTMLVYMPPKFRNALWIRRGSFVIIKKYEEDKGELVHVLSIEQIKEIKRDGKWPKEFGNEFAFEAEEEPEEEDGDDDMISEDSSDSEGLIQA